jgi:hypothetical protein
MGELTLQDLLADYAYLDDLDNRGWAWEFLRRCEKYQSDYRSLQNSKHPKPFDNKHKALAEKWHLKRMMDPSSREIPEFFYECFEQVDYLMKFDPRRLADLWVKMKPPRFSNDVGKDSITCWDLKVRKWSLNDTAGLLYPDHKGISHYTQHHPARHLVQYYRKRFKELQADYIKIAYS